MVEPFLNLDQIHKIWSLGTIFGGKIVLVVEIIPKYWDLSGGFRIHENNSFQEFSFNIVTYRDLKTISIVFFSFM